jgi:hypothetical protein
MDERVTIAMKKSQEHDATLLLMPRAAMLEEEELVCQMHYDPSSPDTSPER